LIKVAPDVNGGKWTKKTLAEHIMVGGLGATSVGTPQMVADEMERWVREGDVDGFNIVSNCKPRMDGEQLTMAGLCDLPSDFCRR
jgi:alkanesulfonate monooxygenase SsuD/methylene tetrahydromethanopterin reductase-like flavin-dependent oxidoreductase (luciferase family)